MNSNTMSIDKIDFDVGNFLNPLHKHKHLKWRVEIGQGEERSRRWSKDNRCTLADRVSSLEEQFIGWSHLNVSETICPGHRCSPSVCEWH